MCEIDTAWEETDPDSGENLYLELKRRIQDAGLLQPQPLYYAVKVPVTLALFFIGWVALVLVDNIWLRLLDAAFLAFTGGQVGYLLHDAGHHQIFRTSWKNDLLGLLNAFVLGSSYSWWVDSHNRHHGRPNQIPFDPTIDYSVLAFCEKTAVEKTGFARLLVKYQSILFIPFSMLYPIGMRIDSSRYLVSQQSRYRALEIVLFISFFPAYFLLLYFSLGIWLSTLFILVHQGLFGLYLSSVIIPNHIGMPVLSADETPDFVRHQVLTSRNVRGPWILDYFFGGLNYQIEHHLFPRMPRNRLRDASRIVRQFLDQKSITYYETGILQCYREVFSCLHRVAKSLKR
jgi:fatty acid desaturase